MDLCSLSPEGNVDQADEFQAVRLYDAEDEQQWSPSISARLKVSLFGTDEATQTNVTEIVDLKALTEVTQTLMKEINFLKKDFELSKHALKADYEQELQQRASELYTRMNDRLKDLEQLHQEKIMIIRRSCMQQLADGLAVIKVAYQNYYISKDKSYVSKGDEDKEESTNENLSFTNEYHDLFNKLQEKEAEISVLKAQLKEYENSTPTFPEQQEDPEKQRLEEENDVLKQEVNRLKKRIDSITDVLVSKEKEIKELITEQRQIKSEYEKNKTRMEEKFLQQKLLMERDTEGKMDAMKQEMQLRHERDIKKIEELEQDKFKLLENQRKPSPLPVVKELPPPVIKDESRDELNKMKKREKEQQKHIESMKKELDWTTRMWEKKFAILRQRLMLLLVLYLELFKGMLLPFWGTLYQACHCLV
ncbi:uncharacterized protein C10orf67 homolog, mitochondrial isoform X2 [Protopterus annectens]|uniref:uncharacterized protein C10orf67 homolog, mitochondrial isoform X2 n=1 Tax=Protopterus annectens TaxID=7888 RepID=UPI001CF9336C|nr:uncharacterized protein C10orf67 homolog, mitochondrial isoform X2 [Protopterus annectens]